MLFSFSWRIGDIKTDWEAAVRWRAAMISTFCKDINKLQCNKNEIKSDYTLDPEGDSLHFVDFTNTKS